MKKLTELGDKIKTLKDAREILKGEYSETEFHKEKEPIYLPYYNLHSSIGAVIKLLAENHKQIEKNLKNDGIFEDLVCINKRGLPNIPAEEVKKYVKYDA